MSESSYPSQQQDKFVLRLPDGMRDRIKAAAEANNRSMNAEIVARLEQSFDGSARGVDFEFAKDVTRMVVDTLVDMKAINIGRVVEHLGPAGVGDRRTKPPTTD